MKKLFSLVASFAMMLSLVACGGGSSAGDTLVYGAEELNGVFSPLYYTTSYDGYVKDLVYQSMLTYDEKNEIVPLLATELPTAETETREDGTTGAVLTFKLRDDVTFSDGSKFDANAVALTFTIMCDSSYSGRFVSYVQDLVGFKEYNAGDAKEVSGIEVVDDNTISFHYVSESPEYLYNMGMMGIVSAEQFKDYKKGNVVEVVQDKNSDPVGTGPYTLNSYSKSEGASLVKREDYWDEGYEIQNVIIKPVDMSTEYQELESGNIDMLQQSIEPSKVAPATKNEDLTINTYPRAGYGFVAFNTSTGATSEKLVRQALMYAFDRESFVSSYFACDKCADGLGQDLGYVPTTIQNAASSMSDVVRGKETVDGLNTYGYNLETANSLLDQAGWVMGSDGIRYKDGAKLTVRMMAMEDHDICNTLIPMWTKDWGSIGVDFQTTTVDFNTLSDTVQNNSALDQWDVFFMANSFTDDSMAGIFDTFYSYDETAPTEGNNYSRLQNAELDEIMTRARNTADSEAAKELWKQAAVIINDEAAEMPVYGNTYYEMYSNKVQNMVTNTLYPWTSGLKNATLKK